MFYIKSTLSCCLLFGFYACNEPLSKSEISTTTMNSKSYISTFTVKQSPEQVYKAITHFKDWWSQSIIGNSDTVGQTFFYHYKDVHLCKVKLIEAIPNEKLVYLVTENEFNFVKDKTEWVNTKLVFEISTNNDSTQVHFVHEGLTPAYECYKVCEDAWTSYIQGSLKSLIETGIGRPNPAEGGLNQALIEKWGLPNK